MSYVNDTPLVPHTTTNRATTAIAVSSGILCCEYNTKDKCKRFV